MLTHQQESILRYSDSLRSSLDKMFKYLNQQLKHRQTQVNMLNPRNVLKRGYSITFKGKSAVKSIDDIEIGDVIHTTLYKGRLTSKIQETKNNEDKDI